jgi:uncharacterized membrane protein
LRVVPQQVRRAHAQQITEHQFALRLHDRTQRRTGLLLLVALAERFVLPDAGITAAIDEASWRGVVDRLVAAIRSDPPADAIAGAVGEIMQLLERHFPPIAGSQGALPDDVIELPVGSHGDFVGD